MIQARLKRLIETTGEIMIPSIEGARRGEFESHGLTDAVILHLCAMQRRDLDVTLLTADTGLAVQAEMLGYSVLNFRYLQ